MFGAFKKFEGNSETAIKTENKICLQQQNKLKKNKKTTLQEI